MAKVQPGWLHVYLITDRSLLPGDRFLEAVEAALEGGIRDLQVREKDLSPDRLFALALALRQMTRRYGARLYINDRVDVALMVDADGVHLPAAGLPPAEVKTRHPHLLVGVSTHSLAGAKRAQEAGADFITFGPVFDTPSKRPYGPPQGLDHLAAAAGAVQIPALALGGVDLNHLPAVRGHGAHGAALIRGIWASPDIKETSKKFVQAFVQGDCS
ncbi:MAG: thiamine phosphate synthase [Nitrospinaceae bacterium]